MTDDQFQKLCNVYGFAPSRALREMLDCAVGQANQAEMWARLDKDMNVTHLDMDLCAKGPHNAYTALAIAIWNKAIETAASKAYGVGDEGMYAQIMELKK